MRQVFCSPANVGAPIKLSSHRTDAVCPSRYNCRLRRTILSAVCIPLLDNNYASASSLSQGVDDTWERLGGGPADLIFPADVFLGEWRVQSVLTKIELPLGPEFADMTVVQRAQEEDLNRSIHYAVAFAENARGQVVPDRRFNTSALMETYLGIPKESVAENIEWNIDNPNMLQMRLPNGLDVMTRVTRRSREQVAENRMNTSEYFEEYILVPDKPQPKIKGSQCFTKYLWRTREAAGAGQPEIVATQVVSEYLSGQDNALLTLQAGGKPVTVYTYRLAFMAVM